MEFYEAYKLLNKIEKSGGKNDAEWNELYDAMLNAAIEYAHVRAGWLLMDHSQRAQEDERRTMMHNAFISRMNILARYTGNNNSDYMWGEICERNRKEIGDFACFIHCILGVKAR